MLRRCLGCMEEYEEEYEVCPHCGYVYGQRAELEYHLTRVQFLQEDIRLAGCLDLADSESHISAGIHFYSAR